MSLVLADRVKEDTISTGTGILTLAGPPSGFQSFSTAIGNGNTTYYCITDGVDWEVGLGQISTAPNTLTRSTVYASSNSGALVNFGTGTKSVFCTQPASQAINASNLTTGNLPFANLPTGTGVWAVGVSSTLTINGLIIGGTYNGQTISSATSLTGTLALAGNFTLNVNKVTMSSTSGDIVTLGTITSTGAATIQTLTIGLGNNALATNTAVGYQALNAVTSGDFNTGIGYQALKSVTYATRNTVIGHTAAAALISGNYNTIIGQSAMALSGYGDSNTVIGYAAYSRNDDGVGSIVIGVSSAIYTVGGAFVTATTNSIFIGTGTRPLVINGTNEIVIGQNTYGKGSNTITLGNDSIVGTYLKGLVGIGITPAAVLTLKAGTATANTAPLKFTTGTALTTPEAGVLEFHNDRVYLTNVAVRRAIDRSSDVIVATTTVVNTATETTIWTGALGTNALKVGNVIKIRVSGQITNATSSDDITIRKYIGSTLVATHSPAIGNVTSAVWTYEGEFTIRTVGVSGTVADRGIANINGTNQSTTSLQTVDTTIAEDITIKVQWANAKAGNTISIFQGFMEFKN